MNYRDIFLYAGSGASPAHRSAFAADLAATFGAQLVGAFARGYVGEPFLPVDAQVWMGAEEVLQVLARHARAVEDLAEGARLSFEAAAAKREIISEWRVLKDADEVVATARRADLMVLAAETGLLDAYDPAALAMAAGGPAIIAPPEAWRADFRRVLVAWNGSREAARALHAAWPILANADRVDALIVSPGGLRGSEGELQRHFERHGIKPNIIIDESDDAAAGRVLRRQVAAIEPDLLVMGLYGHPRFRELVLGGASREMLSQTRVPLFVCH